MAAFSWAYRPSAAIWAGKVRHTPPSGATAASGAPWQTVVPFHKLFSIICAASSNRNEKHQTHGNIRPHDILNRTRIQKIFGRLRADTEERWPLSMSTVLTQTSSRCAAVWLGVIRATLRKRPLTSRRAIAKLRMKHGSSNGGSGVSGIPFRPGNGAKWQKILAETNEPSYCRANI